MSVSAVPTPGQQQVPTALVGLGQWLTAAASDALRQAVDAVDAAAGALNGYDGLALDAEAVPDAKQVWRHMLTCREGEHWRCVRAALGHVTKS